MYGGVKNNKLTWTTFRHNGVMFPEPYKKHDIPILYDGEEIVLDINSEEYATIYSKYIGSEYVMNKKFNKNFFNDWKKILKKNGFEKIKEFEKIDFGEIKKYIDEIREEKKKKKIINDKHDEEHFKFALVDGNEIEIGNFKLEPPGLFLGRGNHPLAGKIKPTILPEDITLNLDKDADIPTLPEHYKKHKWGKIIHDNTSAWIARWKDPIGGKQKYVWLSNKSVFKAETDKHKFDIAKQLGKYVIDIRKTNMSNVSNKNVDMKNKQLATALYFIDYLALRVGNEKGDDEADTVGVCSLRLEHIDLSKENVVKFDFLGKDSIRYKNTINIDSDIYNNLLLFTVNKKKDDYLFDYITARDLNEYLKDFMDGLSSKVFRTYNASILFQEELDKISEQYENYKKSDKPKLLKNEYMKANIKVAVLCNHQKSASKNFNQQIEKINEQIKLLDEKLENTNNKDKIKKIKLKIKELKEKKNIKKDLKTLSVSTSQMNYIDPRITVAFVKKHNLDIHDFFTKALVNKFHWAIDTTDENWTFK